VTACDVCGAVIAENAAEVHAAWHRAITWVPLAVVSDDLLPTQGQRVEHATE